MTWSRTVTTISGLATGVNCVCVRWLGKKETQWCRREGRAGYFMAMCSQAECFSIHPLRCVVYSPRFAEETLTSDTALGLFAGRLTFFHSCPLPHLGKAQYGGGRDGENVAIPFHHYGSVGQGDLQEDQISPSHFQSTATNEARLSVQKRSPCVIVPESTRRPCGSFSGLGH